MKLAVIGLGHVGLPLSSLLAIHSKVVGYDLDSNKIQLVKNGSIPVREPDLDTYLKEALLSGNLRVTSDASEILETDVKIITVGTPYDKKIDYIDYSQLEASLDIIIPNLKKGDVVMLKSTVPPGTTTGPVMKRMEAAGFKVPEDIGLVFSPERMIEGQAIKDFQSLPKIIGSTDDRSFAVARDILSGLGGKIIRVSNPETAETIKMVDNYSRYVFLGLVNELALACEKIGIDVLEVIRAAKDEYPRNAGLLIPGPGVGGSCLNKDPFILRGVLRNSGMEMGMVRSAEEINTKMPHHVADLVCEYRGSGTVTILGVAFKGETDDTRSTPSFQIRDVLVKKGFSVRMTDPYVTGKEITNDLYAACTSSSIIVLVTDHEEYKRINLCKLRNLMSDSPLIIDTRGIIDRYSAIKNGFEYHGLGRL